jgi:hypothetical protein
MDFSSPAKLSPKAICLKTLTSKGNKTVPEKVVATRAEDGQKQNTKTSPTI